MFSEDYERQLLEMHQRTYDRLTELAEERAEKPPWIQQKDIPNYYKGLSNGTLAKYEALGLKRHSPINGGNVFYSTKELDSFMARH